MNKRMLQAIVAGVFAAASGLASAAATVTYADLDKMTDVPRFRVDRESMVYQLNEHFNHLAEKLPAGQELKVEVLDIDLAGDVFPRVPVQDIRVMKGRADWPRIELRYTIEQNGQVVKSGGGTVADMNYLMGYNSYRNEIYSHEKQMLDDWFKKEVLAAH